MMTTALAGCAVGPDFSPPAPPEMETLTPPGTLPQQTVSAKVGGGEAQRFQKGRDIPGDWWRMFGSYPLRTLVDRALKDNPDLASAQAALRIAHANLVAARGPLFPQIDAEFNGTRQQIASAIASPLANNAEIFNIFTGQLNISYTPDVWGGIRRNIESTKALEDNERFQLEATYLTLTSNLVLAAVQEASLRGQIDATQKLIGIGNDTLRLMRTQFTAGQIAEADVVAEEAAVAQIEQTLPPLQRQLSQQRHLLSALTGGLPDREPRERFELAGLHLPRDLPVSLPGKVVEQRPDVRAAEENLHSMSAQIGVAFANRLPNITIAGNVGNQAPQFTQLFGPGTSFYTLTGDALGPIFHGGTLYAREVAARAGFEQASAQYRSTVVQAFQNVANSLTALDADARALQKAVDAEEAANRSLAITRRRLELGDIAFLSVLNAQQTYLQALITRVQAQANRFADTAALFQALGGGWWNRNDVEPRKQYPLFSPFD